MYLLNGDGVVKDSEEVEYELISVSPVRRLEKRMERIEKSPTFDSGSFMRDVLEIVRMNQQLVDELAKSSDALRIELAKLPGKLDEVITNLKDLISFIKASGEEESIGMKQEVMKPVVDKLDEMIKTNKTLAEKNDSMLELLDEISKKLKKPSMPVMRPMPTKRFIPPPMKRVMPPQTTQPLKTPKPIKI